MGKVLCSERFCLLTKGFVYKAGLSIKTKIVLFLNKSILNYQFIEPRYIFWVKWDYPVVDFSFFLYFLYFLVLLGDSNCIMDMLTWAKFGKCHLFMYSRKRSTWNCVIKLRDNRIFKALLWIKKSYKSIDFDLAKHALVFKVNHRWNCLKNFKS